VHRIDSCLDYIVYIVSRGFTAATTRKTLTKVTLTVAEQYAAGAHWASECTFIAGDILALFNHVLMLDEWLRIPLVLLAEPPSSPLRFTAGCAPSMLTATLQTAKP
jgi:hypothetical protein